MTGGSAGLLGQTDPALQAAVNAGLEQVEQRLREVVRSSHPLLTETAAHLVEAGGKRFRPVLALLAGSSATAAGLRSSMPPWSSS